MLRVMSSQLNLSLVVSSSLLLTSFLYLQWMVHARHYTPGIGKIVPRNGK